MKYEVRIKNGVPVSVVPETLRQAGEIYYSVFDGSAEIIVEAETAEEAVTKAKEMYERTVKK